MKWLLVLWMTLIPAIAQEPSYTLKKDEIRVCNKWTWVGQWPNRTIICIEWKIEDCSQRLYKELCKVGR